MSSPSFAEERMQDAQRLYKEAVRDYDEARNDVKRARDDVKRASDELNRCREESGVDHVKYAKAEETLKNADQRMNDARTELKDADQRMDKADQRCQEARRAVKEEEEAAASKKPRLENVTERLKMEIDYPLRLKRFAEAKLVERCIVSEDYMPLPYNQEIQKVFVRECYEKVFGLFLEAIIKKKTNSFGISGTPGIGKSLFFLYILHRIMSNDLSDYQKPKRIIYQTGDTFACYYLEEAEEKLDFVFLPSFQAAGLVFDKTSFYVIDGNDSLPCLSTCITLFICSPRSEHYTHFVKKRSAKQWFLPVWTEEELSKCQVKCYPSLSQNELEERFRIYGGVARTVFLDTEDFLSPMEDALDNKEAVAGLQEIGKKSDTFDASHTLMHMIVGDRQIKERVNAKGVPVVLPYQYLYRDIASNYVGEQLWIRHAERMIENISDIYGSSPSVMSGHLFEIYGHQVFSTGKFSIPCWSLETNKVKQKDLALDGGERIYFRKDQISELDLKPYHYYQPDDDRFPGIDSLSTQGMFQFTVASSHDIRGFQVMESLCQRYKEISPEKPKLYFVVPKGRHEGFKKPKVLSGTKEVKTDAPFELYLLELAVTLSQLRKTPPENIAG